MTEKQKMLSGNLYNASDPILEAERQQARLLFQKFNTTSITEKEKRIDLLQQLMGQADKDLIIEPPFHCDYGYNIHLGKKVFMNFNCCILDVMEVRIGDNVMLGPAVQIYTATHPIDAKERASGLEFAKPVTIGNDVWIGGGAIICPGVNIGDRVVVGAGAVVTKNVPDDVIIIGNPAKILKQL